MNVATPLRASPLSPSTGPPRRSVLRGFGGVTVAALLAAGFHSDRVLALAATPSATEPFFSQWAAAWSGDLALVDGLYAADVVGDDFATGEHFEGVDAIRSHIDGLHAGFPDLKITVTSGFVTENRAALEWVFSGTYTGEPGQPAASGRPVTMRAAALFELADGKIVREAHYWDVYSLLIQIGALPAPDAATPTS